MPWVTPSLDSSAAATIDGCFELLFVEHGHTELAGALELAAWIVSGDEVIRLFRYAAGHLAAVTFDQLFRIFARQRRQRTRQDKSQPVQFARRRALRRTFWPLYPCGAQLGNDFAIVRLAEELTNALGQYRAHVVHVEQRSFVRIEQCVETAEVAGKILRRCLADVADTERVDEARQRGAARLVDRGDDVGRGFLRHAFELRQAGDAELVQIRRGAHDLALDQLVDELV